MSRPTTPRRLLVALAAITLAACATPDSGTTDTSEAIDIVAFAYAPGDLEVTAGTTVVWTNQDSFAHTVTSGPADDPDGQFDEMLGDPVEHGAEGTQASITFDEPGTFPYFCELHPSMVGTITVTS